MNKRLISLMAAALALLSASGQVSFTGYGTYAPIPITPNKTDTGLDMIYVVFDTDSVDMTFTTTSGEPALWLCFDENNWDFPDTIGHLTTLEQVKPNMGYKIVDGTDPFFCWVVNYADYKLMLNDMFFIDDKPCSLLSFKVDGIAHKIFYSSITGKRQVLDRQLELSYSTQVRSDTTDWEMQTVVETFESLDEGISIFPPLCNTVFFLSGDQFLKEWNLEQTIESQFYETQAVKCGSIATQEIRDNNNEKKLDNGLGGSAPVNIVFTGFPSEAVVFRVWEIATDPEFENVIAQYNQDVLEYSFNEAGTYYIRYRVANAAGTCEYYGDTYPVTVSESELICPNFFSPGTTPDVNDVWKVSYKSLVDFHCWIFNRWGTCVCEFTDPGSGWDGTYKGRLVDTGVYYYVVTATGTDGVKYKRRGDISILNYKKGGNGTSNGMGGDTGN